MAWHWKVNKERRGVNANFECDKVSSRQLRCVRQSLSCRISKYKQMKVRTAVCNDSPSPMQEKSRANVRWEVTLQMTTDTVQWNSLIWSGGWPLSSQIHIYLERADSEYPSVVKMTMNGGQCYFYSHQNKLSLSSPELDLTDLILCFCGIQVKSIRDPCKIELLIHR